MKADQQARDRWVVIAGPVSSYTWALLEKIAKEHGIDVAVVHRPPARPSAQFRHETFEPRGVAAYDYSKCSATDLLRFMSVRAAGAILVFTVVSRLPLLAALSLRRSDTPTVFAGDTNVATLLSKRSRSWPKVAAYHLLGQAVTEAWTLGRSNEEAFRLLGMKRMRRLPFYAINFADFGPARQTVREPTPRYKLLVVARLVAEKNLAALVQAVGSPDLRERVTLEIVGDGPERPTLERMIAHGPGNSCLLGALAHREVGTRLAETDALVLPSLREPWGNVVVEALGQGVPVVATPAVGAATSLSDAYGGVRLTSGITESELARGILDLVRDWPSAALSAIADAPRIRAEFDISSVAARMVGVIRELQSHAAVGRMSSCT